MFLRLKEQSLEVLFDLFVISSSLITAKCEIIPEHFPFNQMNFWAVHVQKTL